MALQTHVCSGDCVKNFYRSCVSKYIIRATHVSEGSDYMLEVELKKSKSQIKSIYDCN